MRLGDVADDGEAESEAAVHARLRRLRLAERLENVRQKLRIDSFAGVGDGDLHLRGRAPRRHLAPFPPRGVNFTAFESRFQITCWMRVGSATITPRVGASDSRDGDVLRVRGRVHRLDRVHDHARDLDRLRREAQLAGDDARDVEDVVDEPRLKLRAAGDRRDGLVEHRIVGRHASAACATSRGSRSSACAARARASSGTRPWRDSLPAPRDTTPRRGGALLPPAAAPRAVRAARGASPPPLCVR